MINVNGNISSAALAQVAQQEMRKGISEDRKSAKESAKSAFGRQIDAQKSAIAKQQEEANKRHEAAEKRNGGGFWGSICGAVACIGCIVGGIVACATGAAPLGIALFGLGAASLGAGPAIGNAIVSGGATDLDGIADNIANEVRDLQLQATTAEKERTEVEGQLSEINQRYRQALQDAQAMMRKD